MMENMEKVKDEAYKAAKEILEKAKLEKGDLFVVGCSTSEVCGETIGTHSKPELADMVFAGIYEATKEYGVYLAAQCCEHLNRALILETDAAEKYGYEPVNVMPQPKAGGSFATAAWQAFADPVAVEHIAHTKTLSIRLPWNTSKLLQEWISVIHLSVCICRMSLYRPASRQNRLEMRMSYVPAPA